MSDGKQLVAIREASIHDALEWGKLAKTSGVVPPEMTQYQAAVVVQAGREMGLQPLQSLRLMSFIKGKVCMQVQLQLALAKSRGNVTTAQDWMQEDDDSCTVTLKRGFETVTCTYTLEDAQRAGLVKSGGNWEKYPRQMLRWRAIGDALRLIAPDIVMGLLSPEEAESIAGGTAVAVRTPQSVAEVQATGDEPEAFPPEKEVQDQAPVAETAHPAEAPPPDVPGAPVGPGSPKKRKGKYGFLDYMREFKDKFGNDFYYNALGSFGYQKASEVTKREDMEAIYRYFKEEAEKLDQQEEAVP